MRVGSRRHRRSRHMKASMGVGAILVLAALVGVAFGAFYLSSQETVEVTVADKERVCSSTSEGSSCEYRVYAEGETFVNKDSIIFRKFDSADVQGQLREGETYQVDVAGWRIPLFSTFRNIIEVRDEQ